MRLMPSNFDFGGSITCKEVFEWFIYYLDTFW